MHRVVMGTLVDGAPIQEEIDVGVFGEEGT
jgi:hypothetical protein